MDVKAGSAAKRHRRGARRGPELSRGRIVVLTGGRDAGKTKACLELIERARALGLDCAGLVSPARTSDGHRSGEDVVDVRSGERRQFAFEADAPAEPTGDATGDEGACRHTFDFKVGAWAAGCLDAACPCDLLVVDEVGRLELELGMGWPNALDIVRSGDFGLAVVVVRPHYVLAVLAAIGERHHIGGPPIVATPDDLPDLVGRLQALAQPS